MEMEMVNVKKHLNLLGMKVEDKVTEFKGVVTSVTFDLYGCVQALVHPGVDKDGEIMEQRWFDVSRLGVTSAEPVMERPDYEHGPQAEGKQGAAEKPNSMKA